MEALYLLIPLSLGIIVLAAWIFLRMSASGQFDDMDAPAHSILVDDDRPAPTQITPKSEAPGPQDPASGGTPDAAGRH